MGIAIFITFEGIEGSGKSTVARSVVDYLNSKGRRAIYTREPGGDTVSEKIRDILVNNEMDAITELLLFQSARREHYLNVIRPALDEDIIVVCDRFTGSTIALQGYGRGLPMGLISRLNEITTDDTKPDHIILLDLPVKVGLDRIFNNNRETNRLDREPIDFHERVREGFLSIGNTAKFNADRPLRTVIEDVIRYIDKL